ncbi:MAG: hypothetical protein QM770_07920 [Tepidisphaeraceae bacterium]
MPFLRPKSDDVLTFQSILRNAGVNTHVRKSRGRDIDAACGQLKRRAEQELVQLGTNAKKGFTLTEMLVLLLIVLLLAATFVPYLLNVREQARRTECAAQLRQLRDAFEKYTSANNRYYPAVAVTPPATNSATTQPARASDVMASLWLLKSGDMVHDAALFVCPSSGGAPRRAMKASVRLTNSPTATRSRSPTTLPATC